MRFCCESTRALTGRSRSTACSQTSLNSLELGANHATGRPSSAPPGSVMRTSSPRVVLPQRRPAAGEYVEPRLRRHHLLLGGVTRGHSQGYFRHRVTARVVGCFRRLRMQRTCQQCGQHYETPPSQKRRFCSSACTGLSKRKGEERRCAQCDTPFWAAPSQAAKRYCSRSCARTAANLTPANPSYSRDISGERNPMYGRGMAGEANPMYGKRKAASPRWRGGRKVRKDGYVLVVASDDHPYPADMTPSGTKYVLEHRLVMERALGRYLEPGEVVHHVDENPSNNALENLRLFASQGEHVRVGHATRG